MFEDPPELPDEVIEILFPKNSTTEKRRPCNSDIKTVEKNFLKKTVDSIPSKCADIYEDWCRIIWAIANTAKEKKYNALDIANEFSKQSSKYVNIEDVRKIYEKADGRITFGTLRKLLISHESKDTSAEIPCNGVQG